MRAEVESFLSALQSSHLRSRGFRKKGHRYSCQRDGYVETVSIQGSAYNDSSGPWRFYLNVAVDFPDLRPMLPVRLGMVIPDAPKEFDFRPDTQADLERELVGWVDALSARIDEQLPQIHEALEQQRFWIDC